MLHAEDRSLLKVYIDEVALVDFLILFRKMPSNIFRPVRPKVNRQKIVRLESVLLAWRDFAYRSGPKAKSSFYNMIEKSTGF